MFITHGLVKRKESIREVKTSVSTNINSLMSKRLQNSKQFIIFCYLTFNKGSTIFTWNIIFFQFSRNLSLTSDAMQYQVKQIRDMTIKIYLLYVCILPKSCEYTMHFSWLSKVPRVFSLTTCGRICGDLSL